MFSIGDLVVHPMHGAGVIDDIVQEKVAGVMKEYYVFPMVWLLCWSTGVFRRFRWIQL